VSEGDGVARETDLFAPVRDLLASQGYEVRAEVGDCDVAAEKGDSLVIVELKRRIDLKLILQATARQRITDSVYVAVPAETYAAHRRRRHLMRLLRQLELGLLLVHLTGRKGSDGARVEVAFHPMPYDRRKRRRARRHVIQEMHGRNGGQNIGGSAPAPRMTAYREEAVYAARCLDRHGALSPKGLRDLGCSDRVGKIVYDNFYGWFQRMGRGLYGINDAGRDAAAGPQPPAAEPRASGNAWRTGV
jgi:hypothetical protein